MSDNANEDSPKKVKYLYHKPDNYKPVYVNGLYGGMTPKGELMCHFFMEYVDIPAEENIPIDKKGRLQTDQSKKLERVLTEEDEVAVRRDIKVGVIIPVQHIRSFATWMMDNLEKSGIVVKTSEEDEDDS